MAEGRTQGAGDRGKRLVKWALLTVVCLMGLIGLLWTGLQTPWAKTRLENLVSSLTAKTGDYQVMIQGLDGWLPFFITVEQVTLSDAKGPWLEGEKFDFSMNPWDLISGSVDIKWLRMEHLTLSRLPERRESAPKKEETPTKNGAFSLPHVLVQEIRLQRIDLGEALVGKPMAFSLNARLKTAKDRIQTNASLLDLNRAHDTFKLKATYNLRDEHLMADVTYHEARGGLVAGLLGLKDLEDIQLTANAQGPVSHIKGDMNLNMGGYGNAAIQYDVSHQETVALKLRGRIKADRRIIPSPELAELAGPKVTIEAHAEMKGETLTLETVELKGSHARLTADGWVNLKESIFYVAYRMGLDHSDRGISKLETLPAGEVQAKGKISGKFDDFAAHVTLNSRSLRFKNLEIKEMTAQLTADGLPQKPSGNIHMKASSMDQPLQLNSDFAWSGKTLTVRDARVKVPGIDLATSLHLTPGTEDFSGRGKGRITSLEIVQALTGVVVQGTGAFQIEVGKSSTPKGHTSVALDANFKGLKYQDYSAATLNVTARVDDLKKMQGKASLKATNMPFGSSRLETLSLGAKGALSSAEITLQTKGMTKTATEAPLFLAAKIRVKRTDLWQLRLETLKAGYEGLKVNLQKPATLTYHDDGRIALDNLQLKTDKGLFQAMAKLDKDKVEAKVRITDLPLSLLEPFVGQDLDGRAEVSLELSGPLADPGVNVTVHIKEYKIMGRDGTQPILLNVKLHSRRDGERLLADLELSGLGKTPFKAAGSIPAHISLKPFAFDMDKNGKLEAKLQGILNLAVLQTLPAMDNQSLRGLVNVDMGIGGSLEKWELNGGVTLEKGRYENVDQGVLLDKIQVKMSAEGRILKLAHLTATDGGTGTISLNGRTDVDPPFRTEIALILKQATLLRQENLTVTAGGNLDVKGNKDRIDLTGEINLDRTEIAIPKRFPPDVTVIPVTIINDPATSEKSESKKGETLIQMDLGVNIPDKCFVRGRGLDAEFKGRLTVQGPAGNPVVRGTLNVVRGTFLCLSRTFKVTNGQIAFDGATPPVPFLNINTQVNAGEITAQVDVTGPADAFKLKLSSLPPLPQDEIMAQILFGQSVAKLNTFQALQMAYSINELAGGYGPDVMGKTRSFLGLDRLGFSGGDGDTKNDSNGNDNSPGPSVAMGKYVTDRVYVGIEQDITDAKQDVIVEVNITPNFTVESKAGTRSGAGLGFSWNYDY
ncbi:MAG: translocation/assembly module TamB domain-containing protein [Deltaproteobacteria bacterium]|nr:translocation/assembly module TamB domain-containing protein [Deltaproteobacteria bacterium]